MAGEWTTLPLEDCMAAIIDYRGKSPDKTAFGVPLVTAKIVKGGRIEKPEEFIAEADFDDWMRRGMPKPGDIVMTTEAPLGEVAQLDGRKVALAQRVITLRGKPDVLDNTFLKFLLQSNPVQEELRSRGTGTTVVGIRQSELRKVSLTLPPLAEQKAIAAVLGALDDKIELNRRMNATLEAMARALFQSWFIDFNPVRANLDRNQPSPAASRHPLPLGEGRGEGRFALDPATAALFPDSFQDSEAGHIPKGWKTTTLGACIGFRSGFSFKSQDWQESGVPVVKIGSVKPGIIDLTQVSYVSEEIAQQAARYRLSTGDMLIGMTGYVGEVGLVPPSDNSPLLNQRVGKFVMAKPGTESLAFWYCTTRQPEFKTFVEARSHGTAQANVSGESIMEFPLVVPRAELLDEFNRKCQPLLDRILANHGESRTLETLRDTLLPKLLSGELSVADMKKNLP
jgi:type I restriction enzyme S subunit